MEKVNNFSWLFPSGRKKGKEQPVWCLLARFLGVRYEADWIINSQKGGPSCGSGGRYEKIGDLIAAVWHKKLSRSRDILMGRIRYPVSIDRWTIPETIPARSVLVFPNIEKVLCEAGYDEFFQKLARDAGQAMFCIVTCNLSKYPAKIQPDLTPSRVKRAVWEMLAHYGMVVEFAGYCSEMLDNPDKNTLIWIISPHPISVEIPQKDLDAFKVVALIAVYNEEDIIASVTRKLAEQGIDVYIIDNWSTDSTGKILKDLHEQGIILGFEQYPAEGPSEMFDLKGILTRKEELARELQANWVVHFDADEVRVSPWKERSYKEAVFLVDQMGFNAIDHTIIDFVPVDNGFTPDLDFESYFSYFNFGKRTVPRINTWKRQEVSVDLSSRGGHEVQFEERRVFPFNFLIKHYPVRSQAHGERKFFHERQPRSGEEKRKLNWHIHYFKYKKGYSFVKKPEQLILFEADQFMEQYLTERLSGIMTDYNRTGEKGSGAS